MPNIVDPFNGVAKNDMIQQMLAEKVVFVGAPLGPTSKSILKELNEVKFREKPEFKRFLDKAYAKTGSLSTTAQVTACLNTLVRFVEETPQPKPPAEKIKVLTDLKNNIADLKNGITENAQHLTTLKRQIEELCFCITQSNEIPLNDRLQLLYNLYSPINMCAPGAQGQIIASHKYVTANNLLQKLGDFAKAVITDLNRGYAGQEFDAGPHAANKDLINTYKRGLRLLNVAELVRLNDPYGDGHSQGDIDQQLAKDFTIGSFMASVADDIVANLTENIQLSFSLKDIGLDHFVDGANPAAEIDQVTSSRRRTLQAAFKLLNLDILNKEQMNGIFSSEILGTNNFIQFCNDLNNMVLELGNLNFGVPADVDAGGYYIDIRSKEILVYYKENENSKPRQIMAVPVTHELYDRIAEFKGKNKSTFDLYDVLNPKNKKGTHYVKINNKYIKHTILNILTRQYHMLAETASANYKLLQNTSDATPTEYTKQYYPITDKLQAFVLVGEKSVRLFVERDGKFIDPDALSGADKEALANFSIDLLANIKDKKLRLNTAIALTLDGCLAGKNAENIAKWLLAELLSDPDKVNKELGSRLLQMFGNIDECNHFCHNLLGEVADDKHVQTAMPFISAGLISKNSSADPAVVQLDNDFAVNLLCNAFSKHPFLLNNTNFNRLLSMVKDPDVVLDFMLKETKASLAVVRRNEDLSGTRLLLRQFAILGDFKDKKVDDLYKQTFEDLVTVQSPLMIHFMNSPAHKARIKKLISADSKFSNKMQKFKEDILSKDFDEVIGAKTTLIDELMYRLCENFTALGVVSDDPESRWKFFEEKLFPKSLYEGKSYNYNAPFENFLRIYSAYIDYFPNDPIRPEIVKLYLELICNSPYFVHINFLNENKVDPRLLSQLIERIDDLAPNAITTARLKQIEQASNDYYENTPFAMLIKKQLYKRNALMPSLYKQMATAFIKQLYIDTEDLAHNPLNAVVAWALNLPGDVYYDGWTIDDFMEDDWGYNYSLPGALLQWALLFVVILPLYALKTLLTVLVPIVVLPITFVTELILIIPFALFVGVRGLTAAMYSINSEAGQTDQILNKYNDSELIKYVLSNNLPRINELIANPTISNDELRAALYIAKNIISSNEIQSALSAAMQQPSANKSIFARFISLFKKSSTVIAPANPLPTSEAINQKSIHKNEEMDTTAIDIKDKTLQQNLIDVFKYRKDGIDEMIQQAQAIQDPKERSDLEQKIINEVDSLQADWKEFLQAAANIDPDQNQDTEIKAKANEYTTRRLLILSSGPEQSKEMAALDALDATLRNKNKGPARLA